MQCLHINIRQVTFILLSLIINNFTVIQMADNEMDHPNKERKKEPPSNNEDIFSPKLPTPDLILYCPTNSDCSDLPVPCIECDLTFNCIYGNSVSTICKPKPMIDCKGARQFTKELICRYCYQTEIWEHVCDLKANCNSVASPRPYYATNCTVKDDILCLGHRTFSKNVLCNWTGGYHWSTALILSITLGGFGADRFYLGHWQEGIGKLFSFGGLGVWTIIDVILISLHYLGPADGSLYI